MKYTPYITPTESDITLIFQDIEMVNHVKSLLNEDLSKKYPKRKFLSKITVF